ncbi:unnamed protein product [Lupinus luteus]|uniref:Uncharacterized protein n=1 Tax=Lupinus luteus TaxID=3873 RepID=A0AAV1X3E8_LUPLU
MHIGYSFSIIMDKKHKKNYRYDGYSLLVLEKRCASSDGYGASIFVAANDFTESH